MSKVSTCLWFGKDAETAVRFYVSIVRDLAGDRDGQAQYVRQGGGASLPTAFPSLDCRMSGLRLPPGGMQRGLPCPEPDGAPRTAGGSSSAS
jgi:hypothetical protein